MTILEIIKAAGGRDVVAKATGLTPDAIYKWPKIGIPDRHWGTLINLSGNSLDAARLHKANQRVRADQPTPETEGKMKEAV